MIKVSQIFSRLQRRWTKFRLTPIRVLCFHQVSEVFDENVFCKPDWIPMNLFQSKILGMVKAGYEFITLEQATRHLRHDFFRRKKYAVLTADDGLKCQLELIPWIEMHRIPLTIFTNVKMLNGKTLGEQFIRYFNLVDPTSIEQRASSLYYTARQLSAIRSPYLYIAAHGVDHIDVRTLTETEMDDNILCCIHSLGKYYHFTPYYAYTYGAHTYATDTLVRRRGLIPVYTDGQMNYFNSMCIHREIINSKLNVI